jgi:prepilin-type N-terminal cleavage/methylation domain-containing protein
MKAAKRVAKRGAKRGGFSLIEVLVAMALALLLVVGAAELLTLSLGAKRKGDITAALTHALTARLETLKSRPFEDGALSPGVHAETVRGEPGGFLIAEEWEVADDGDRMKRIGLRVRYAGRPGPETAAVLFISRDLGFRP